MSRLRKLHPLAIALLLESADASAVWASTPDLESRVNGLVTRQYTHGMPLDSARVLGPDASALLLTMLRSDSTELWLNAAQGLAFIGSVGSFTELRTFIETRFTGVVDDATIHAMSAALSVLGVIPVDHAPGLVEYLKQASDSSHWSRVAWHCERIPDAARNRWFSTVAFSSLAWTGTKEADRFFINLAERETDSSRRKVILGFRDVNRQVMKVGLARYEREARARFLRGE